MAGPASARIARKAEWPDWNPPAEMTPRWPHVHTTPGGPDNPLGARALYLFEGNKDTLYRIHGTNEPEKIGQAVSSGCIRMRNIDMVDLYNRVSRTPGRHQECGAASYDIWWQVIEVLCVSMMCMEKVWVSW